MKDPQAISDRKITDNDLYRLKEEARQFKQLLDERFSPLVATVYTERHSGSTGYMFEATLKPRDPKPNSQQIGLRVIITEVHRSLVYQNEMFEALTATLLERGIKSLE